MASHCRISPKTLQTPPFALAGAPPNGSLAMLWAGEGRSNAQRRKRCHHIQQQRPGRLDKAPTYQLTRPYYWHVGTHKTRLASAL